MGKGYEYCATCNVLWRRLFGGSMLRGVGMRVGGISLGLRRIWIRWGWSCWLAVMGGDAVGGRIAWSEGKAGIAGDEGWGVVNHEGIFAAREWEQLSTYESSWMCERVWITSLPTGCSLAICIGRRIFITNLRIEYSTEGNEGSIKWGRKRGIFQIQIGVTSLRWMLCNQVGVFHVLHN